MWLNDNKRMLFVSQGKIFLFDTATRKYEPVLTVTDQDVDIGSPSLSPDNKTLYFTFVSAEADIGDDAGVIRMHTSQAGKKFRD